MNEIEEKLWNYIDGSCSAEEHASISFLISTDEVYKQKYQELLQLNATFAAMELDEPSMAFTYNVMEAIRLEAPVKPLKSAIDKRIIWGISAFFAITIVTLLVFILANMNWSAGNGAVNINLPVKITVPDMAGYFNSTTLRVFILFDIVLSLFILDTYLRKKLNNKTA